MAYVIREYEMKRLKKYSLATAVVSMVVMPIAPVTAAEFNPIVELGDTSVEQGEPTWIEDNQDRRRRRFRKHRRGIRGGDILVGAAILGGIAILAGSSNRKRRGDYQRRSPQRAPQNFPQSAPQGNVISNDIGNAINLCSNAALQSAGSEYNINQIRNVSRDGDGWRVDGDLAGPTAASFACGVTAGNVQFIQLN